LGLTIATASWILVVSPRAAEATALFEDDKIPAIVSLDQVDGCAHARDASPNDDDSSLRVVFVTHRHLRPWHVTPHLSLDASRRLHNDRARKVQNLPEKATSHQKKAAGTER
jgi:hypothetical protein